jgi:hypothetical protein
MSREYCMDCRGHGWYIANLGGGRLFLWSCSCSWRSGDWGRRSDTICAGLAAQTGLLVGIAEGPSLDEHFRFFNRVLP